MDMAQKPCGRSRSQKRTTKAFNMNSPFFAMGVSYLDAVDVTPLEDSHHVLHFECINKRGGHSTFMILVEDAEPRFDAYWARLKTLGCSYEGAHIKLSIGR